MSIDAMKQALEALENVWSNGLEELTTAPMEALRAAIEQAQEPVAYAYTGIMINGEAYGPHLIWKKEYMDAMSHSKRGQAVPLYTATRQRQGLTVWCGCGDGIMPNSGAKCGNCLAAESASRDWQGLTADEIWACNVAPAGHHVESHICVAHQNVLDFAEAIEAKLKEKNRG